MAKYLFIESREPYESRAVHRHMELATHLRQAGHEVCVFLVQNGVLPVRAQANRDAFASILTAGVEVLADEFSLRERGVDAQQAPTGIQPAPIDVVVDRLAAGWKTLFL